MWGGHTDHSLATAPPKPAVSTVRKSTACPQLCVPSPSGGPRVVGSVRGGTRGLDAELTEGRERAGSEFKQTEQIMNWA